MPVAALEVALPGVAKRAWTAGDQRHTPKGTPLDGVYEDSYCYCEIGSGNDGELATLLDRTLATLSIRQDVLLSLKSQGVGFSFFICWYPDGDSGETFDADLLARMGELGISLELNVLGYPSTD